MAAWPGWSLLSACLLVSASQEKKNITVEPGQNVALLCRAPNNPQAFEWSRADLGNEYVFLYRDGAPTTTNQHSSFENRVELKDTQMKDGDVSLILKNVTINDAGTYECRVKTGMKRRKRTNISGDPISIIYLSVAPPGLTRGSVGLIAGVAVLAVLVAAFVIYRKYKD